MGEPTEQISRIVLQLCVDGVPAHNRTGCGSVKPIQHMILSFAPWLRSQAKHMLVQMLIPNHLKGKQARKYYDWAATYEMNDLHQRGVQGVRVIVYGTSLDSPGRSELLGMQTCIAFYPCPHCLHTWQPGLRGQVHGGYRCFLDPRSPWRQRQFLFKGHRYMFRDVEKRKTPDERTDQNVKILLSLMRPRKPFCGHKCIPCLAKWLSPDWEGNMCDTMHDIKCMCVMILKCLVGKGSYTMYKNWGPAKRDSQHRNDCEFYGVFEDVLNDTDRFVLLELFSLKTKEFV